MRNTLTALGVAASLVTAAPVLGENRADRIRPDAPELAAYGAHVIGVQTLDFVHAAQIDIVNTTADSEPLYDRPLTVEVWYPAADGTTPGGTYQVTLRDGKTVFP